MNLLIESLKRQYQKGKITKEKIEQMETEGQITEEELKYILNKEE